MNCPNGMSCSMLFTNCTIFSPASYAYSIGITIPFIVYKSGSHILLVLQGSQIVTMFTPLLENQNM
jgi:hypothetical protein